MKKSVAIIAILFFVFYHNASSSSNENEWVYSEEQKFVLEKGEILSIASVVNLSAKSDVARCFGANFVDAGSGKKQIGMPYISGFGYESRAVSFLINGIYKNKTNETQTVIVSAGFNCFIGSGEMSNAKIIVTRLDNAHEWVMGNTGNRITVRRNFDTWERGEGVSIDIEPGKSLVAHGAATLRLSENIITGCSSGMFVDDNGRRIPISAGGGTNFLHENGTGSQTFTRTGVFKNTSDKTKNIRLFQEFGCYSKKHDGHYLEITRQHYVVHVNNANEKVEQLKNMGQKKMLPSDAWVEIGLGEKIVLSPKERVVLSGQSNFTNDGQEVSSCTAAFFLTSDGKERRLSGSGKTHVGNYASHHGTLGAIGIFRNTAPSEKTITLSLKMYCSREVRLDGYQINIEKR